MIGELSSYELADLVLFTRDAWFDVIAQQHRDAWPLQIVAKLFALAILLLVWRRPSYGDSVVLLLLVVAWDWLAWSFLHVHLAPLHWVADWYAAAFSLQAVMMLAWAVYAGVHGFSLQLGRSGLAIALYLFALFGLPALALIDGRDWHHAELFGLTPDATVLATLALLASMRARWSWTLLVIPCAWCIVSAATSSALGLPGFWLLPAAACIVIAASLLPVAARA